LTFKTFLKEEYFTALKGTGGMTVEIFKNPKKDEFSEIRKLDDEVRGWLNPETGDTYMWASGYIEHEVVASKNKLPTSTWIPFYIYPGNRLEVSSYSLPNHYNFYVKKDFDFIINTMKKNKNLQSLIGANIIVS